MSINKLLAQAIAESKMPISRIAEKSGISRQHIYKIMNGEKNVSSVTLENICKAINVLPSSLYEGNIGLNTQINNSDNIKILARNGKEIKLNEKNLKLIEELINTLSDEEDDYE